MVTELEDQIIRQIEYYFGDINLPRDRFMQEKIKEDDGWISVETMLTFKRLANICSDPDTIVAAVEKSENKIVEVSEDKKKFRRNPDLVVPEFNEERRKELMTRTAYAKGFPLDETLNNIIKFLEAYGPLDSVIRRTNRDKDNKFKGSCFVIFKTIELCKKFVEAESVKYNDTELIRKWQSDYIADKRKEIEERKQSKKERKQKGNNVEKKQIEFPKGAILHFTGITPEQTLTREEIKEKIKEISDLECSYIDFKKGDLEGHVRFAKENEAVEFHKKLTDGELEIGDIKLKTKVLEGEEEEEFLKKTSDSIMNMRQKQKGGRNNRKRKGNFGGDHGHNKQAKTENKEKETNGTSEKKEVAASE